MTEPDLIGYFNEHVFYEWLMLHFSKHRLEEGEPQLIWNAMFAAFNVSARNLYVFLGHREKGNMNVADYRLYCPSFAHEKVDPIRRTLRDLNSQCLHLSKERTREPDQKINLDRIRSMSAWIERNMARLLKSFNDDFRSKLRPEWSVPLHQQQVMVRLGPTGPSSSALSSIIESGPTSIGQMMPFEIAPKR